jgi:hypothetical protein
MAVPRLKMTLVELDTADPDRARDIVCFAFRFLFGLPIEAREQYGTFGIGDLMTYTATRDFLKGNRVYPAGSPLNDTEIRGRLAQLLDTGAVIETQDLPPVKETTVAKPEKETEDLPPVKETQVRKQKRVNK